MPSQKKPSTGDKPSGQEKATETVTIKFTVTPASAMKYSVSVNASELEAKNNVATADLAKGVEHLLHWVTYGNEGDAISIVGKLGEREVVNVKSSKIPKGRPYGMGSRLFTP